MDFFDVSFWQGFLGNLLATILGVALGIPVAFWINQLIEFKTRREKVIKIYDALHGELSINYEWILDWKDSPEDHWKLTVIGVNLEDEVWNTFADGGELEWVDDLHLLGLLANAYTEVKRVKYLSDKYLNFNMMDPSTAKYILGNLESAVSRASVRIESAVRMLSTYLKIFGMPEIDLVRTDVKDQSKGSE